MAWLNSSWLYRKKITVDADEVDANLTDFPVYVNLAKPIVSGCGLTWVEIDSQRVIWQ